METIRDYIAKTESATKKLFEGIDGYVSVLKKVPTPVFVRDFVSKEQAQRETEEWARNNEKWFKAQAEAQKEYMDELFAQGTLCGGILQIAAMGIRKYSANTVIPVKVQGIPKIKNAEKFCIGRKVRELPMGLIIYAGRNQYNHLDEENYREPTKAIFSQLAQMKYPNIEPLLDPAFDLDNPGIITYSSNITAVLEWRSYEKYEADMLAMLDS